jgi:Spy/CpxP family protein refolding chaperone
MRKVQPRTFKKTIRVGIRNLPTIMIAALVAGPRPVFAQSSPVENPETRPAPQRRPAFQERLATIVQRGDFGVLRILTEEQRVSFREAMEAQRDQIRALEEKLHEAHKEAIAAGLKATFDEDAVRKKALEVGRLEAELAVLRARALGKVKPPLSAEQIDRIKNAPPFIPGESRLRPAHRVDRAPAGPRDENDLPAKPKSE